MTAFASEIEGAPVQHLTETGSTNEDALAAGRAGRDSLLWVRADRQLSGRGRHGRAWASPVGNLYCSLLFPTAADPAALPQLSHVAAVALATAIRVGLPEGVDLRIKWPNDLLLNGAKVAGILVEGTRTIAGQQLCVIGCGVNCASAPDGLPYRATSLAEVGVADCDADVLFRALQKRLGAAIATWDSGRGYPTIRDLWLAHALPFETPLVVRNAGITIEGRFQGIDQSGRLLLTGPQGLLVVEAGDVTLN